MSLKKYLGIHRIFLFCCFTFFTFYSQAQGASVENTDERPLAESRATGPHIRVALLSEDQALVPNTQQYLAIEVQPDPEWHTYWLNPGDSGEPPKVTWSENTETLSFGDIQWPTPSAIPVAHLVNYGYVSADEANQLSADRNAAPTHVLFDPEGEVGKMYAAKTTPHMYIIDPEGELRYAGAIDSIKSANPADIPKAVNYVNASMDALNSGKSPEKTLTPPYGCSIKYKS